MEIIVKMILWRCKMEKLTDKLIVRVGSQRKQKLHEGAEKNRMRFSKYVRLIIDLGEAQNEKLQSENMQTANPF